MTRVLIIEDEANYRETLAFLLQKLIPALNEETNIVFCLEGLARQTLKPRQIILVDDGSKDRSVEIIEELAQLDPVHVKFVLLRRNFGQTAAVAA